MEALCNSIHSFYNDLETQKDVFMYHAAAMKIADTFTPRFVSYTKICNLIYTKEFKKVELKVDWSLKLNNQTYLGIYHPISLT